MRRFDHWTARYVLDRSRNILSNFAHPNWPWLTPAAVEILERRVNSQHSVFEWGAGRSTLWLARRVSRVTSIEHHPLWFERVQSLAGRQGFTNIALKLVSDSECPASPDHYVDAIYESPGFDLILVDGLHRQYCVLAALDKIKAGGMVVVDNANWYLPSRSRAPASRTRDQGPASTEWAAFERRVAGWQVSWTSNGVTDTAIWFAPAAPHEKNLSGIAQTSCFSKSAAFLVGFTDKPQSF
jgi:Methyltransferase domain